MRSRHERLVGAYEVPVNRFGDRVHEDHPFIALKQRLQNFARGFFSLELGPCRGKFKLEDSIGA